MTSQTVAEIGEFALIELLAGSLPDTVRTDRSLDVGIGDDTAVWSPSPGESLLVTADSMVENIHFRTDWSTWYSIGWKALASNLSDIAAMGGAPRLALVSLALRGGETVAELLDLYHGMSEAARQHNVIIAGGDVVSSRHETSIHITLLGETRANRYLSRSTALVGDAIVVSGTLGASAAGLALLELPSTDPRREATTADHLLQTHREPQPRVALGALLLELGATAAMDLSDGLLGDLPKILAASSVSASIEHGSIPVSAAVRALFPDSWSDLAMRGGEDFEILATLPSNRVDSTIAAAAEIGHTLTRIGTITESLMGEPQMSLLQPSGETVSISPGAWDHFAP